MSSLAEAPKSKIVAIAQRAKSQLANVKKEAKQAASTGINLAVAYGVGSGIGYARKKWGEGAKKEIMVPGTAIPADLAGGLLLGAGCLVGVFDEMTPVVTNVACSTLAASGALSQFTA